MQQHNCGISGRVYFMYSILFTRLYAIHSHEIVLIVCAIHLATFRSTFCILVSHRIRRTLTSNPCCCHTCCMKSDERTMLCLMQ